MKKIIKLLILFITFMSCNFLHAQDTLEEIVTWELYENIEFRCSNPNVTGSDLNNDGYDDFTHFSYNNATGERKFQFYFGSSNPGTEPNLEISTELPVNFDPSWGGDLNADGYKDIVFSVQTDWGDPGDIYICLGSENIDLEPELILHGEDYAPDPYHLGFTGINAGYDFNGDGYNDILAGGTGDDFTWRGMVAIFFGGNVLDTEADFHLLGNNLNQLGKYKTVGDINGDGFDDLIISRNTEQELDSPIKFEIYLGGSNMDTVMDAELSEIWVDTYDMLAYGDVNNDNYDDLLLTGSLDGSSGLIGLYFGCPDLELVLNSFNALPNGGFSILNFDNDEYIDISATYKYNSLGYINIFLGSEGVDFDPEYSIQFGNFNNQYGKIGCTLYDFNGDGEDEILVNDGNPYNSATMYGLTGGNEIDDYEFEISNYKLYNYPNPFNPSGAGRSPVTTISYELPINIANPVIDIFNIKGEKIRTFNCQNQMLIIWDGTDNHQNQVSSGIYLYRLKTNNFVSKAKKMTLLK